MCTLSIIPFRGRIIVTMNRDEQRGRPESQDMHAGPDFAYPCDAQTGGTWFGINRHGVIMALLNRYDIPYKPTHLSRGRFIPKLIAIQDVDAAVHAFEQLHAQEDNPFDLILISRQQTAQLSWDGASCSKTALSTDKPLFFTSSSEKQKEVLAFRQSLFGHFIRETWPDKTTPAAILDLLHLKDLPDKSSAAILMRRDVTHTKSVVQAVLSDAGLAAFYWTEDQIQKMGRLVIDEHEVRPRQVQFSLLEQAG